jgi:hypothetical protein
MIYSKDTYDCILSKIYIVNVKNAYARGRLYKNTMKTIFLISKDEKIIKSYCNLYLYNNKTNIITYYINHF